MYNKEAILILITRVFAKTFAAPSHPMLGITSILGTYGENVMLRKRRVDG